MLTLLRSLALHLAVPFLSGALSQRLRRLLLNPKIRKAVIAIIQTAAAAANLTKEERRRWVLARVAELLQKNGIDLSDAELNLLVELLYGWLKHTHPGAIAPSPASLGRRP